ncbi:MAG: hypothetical protein HZB26_08035 [Candidatus Hydrogenedentes bacterium]|nr:hypothetical protein [Candidatus Hydrogenedentota bacterium]
MRIYHSPSRKATLSGWAKWILVIAIPFSILFFETWLRTQSLQYGFVKNDLMKKQAELNERLKELRADEAGLKRMDRIEAKAPDLGLVEPAPAQIKIVRVKATKSPDMEMMPVDENYSMARLSASAPTAPADTDALPFAE